MNFQTKKDKKVIDVVIDEDEFDEEAEETNSFVTSSLDSNDVDRTINEPEMVKEDDENEMSFSKDKAIRRRDDLSKNTAAMDALKFFNPHKLE